MKISYLVLLQKKVCLSAWNFTIRDSVLGLCGLLEPLLKGQMGVSARGARVKGQERLSHFYWGVLWPRSFSESCFPPRPLPFFVLSEERLSVLQFENLWD